MGFNPCLSTYCVLLVAFKNDTTRVFLLPDFSASSYPVNYTFYVKSSQFIPSMVFLGIPYFFFYHFSAFLLCFYFSICPIVSQYSQYFVHFIIPLVELDCLSPWLYLYSGNLLTYIPKPIAPFSNHDSCI